MSDPVEKINEIANNLGDSSKNKRQRAANTLLSKITILSKTSIGELTKDNVESIANGAYKGLLIAIETKDSDFCSLLLKIIRFMADTKHSKSLAIVEKIAQSLTILETEDVKTFPLLEDAIISVRRVLK